MAEGDLNIRIRLDDQSKLEQDLKAILSKLQRDAKFDFNINPQSIEAVRKKIEEMKRSLLSAGQAFSAKELNAMLTTLDRGIRAINRAQKEFATEERRQAQARAQHMAQWRAELRSRANELNKLSALSAAELRIARDRVQAEANFKRELAERRAALQREGKERSVLRGLAEAEKRLEEERLQLARARVQAEAEATAEIRARKEAILANIAAMKAAGTRLGALSAAEMRVGAAPVGKQLNLPHIQGGLFPTPAQTRQLAEAAKQMGYFQSNSFNLLRVFQDLPYGILGVANNLQFLSEQIGGQIAQGARLRSVLGTMFVGLFRGPMAIPTLITALTLLASDWGRLAENIDSVSAALGRLNRQKLNLKAGIGAGRQATQEGFQEFLGTLNSSELIQLRNEIMQRQAARARSPQLYANLGMQATPQQRADEDLVLSWLNTEIGRRMGGSGTLRGLLGSFEGLPGVSGVLRRYIEPIDLEEQQRDRDALTAAYIESLGSSFDDRIRAAEAQRDYDIQKIIEERGANDPIAAQLIAYRNQQHANIIAAIEREREEEEWRNRPSKAVRNLKRLEPLPIVDVEKIRREAQQRAARRAASQMDAERFAAQERFQIGRTTAAGIFNPFERDRFMVDVEQRYQTAQIDSRIKFLQEQLKTQDLEEEQIRAHNNEIKALLAEKNAIIKEAEEETAQITRDQAWTIAEHLGQTVGFIGDTMGSMAVIFAKEGRKGLEENKKFLIAQATANAIASGVGIASSIFRDPTIPFWLKVPMAAAASASVVAGLMAQIRQINNAGSGGSSSFGGGWTALNSTVNASRAADFEMERQREATANRQESRDDIRGLRSDIQTLSQNISNQKIVYDDRTAADVYERGKRTIDSIS